MNNSPGGKSMTKEWMSKYQQLLDHERGAAADLEKATEKAHMWIRYGAQELEMAQEKYANRLKQLDKRRKQFEQWQDDPLVWVRQRGPKASVYHSITKPCGWSAADSKGTIRPGYVKMLRGEAQAQGLRACSSCGYYTL